MSDHNKTIRVLGSLGYDLESIRMVVPHASILSEKKPHPMQPRPPAWTRSARADRGLGLGFWAGVLGAFGRFGVRVW